MVLDWGTRRVSEVTSEAFKDAQTIAWAPDGRGWILTKTIGAGGSEMLYVRPDGHATALWSSSFQRAFTPIASPDGRRLGFTLGWAESNVWMLRGF
jgi:hypothetical protein